MHSLICAVVFATSTMLVTAIDLDTVYQWKYVDYVWESDASRQKAIDNGDYNHTQVLPMDVDRAADGRVFVSLIGTKGVPAVLGTVSDKMGPSGPLVKPYPDWSYFKKGDCDSIQNVYRIAIDECQRLWVLDTGFLEDEEMVCEAQLFVFDLKTDKLIQRIKIPDQYAKGKNGQTLLATPIVETEGRRCQDTTVYMADVYGQGLVIWRNGRFSRLENPAFGPSEGAANITSGNFTAEWDTGIVTMDISPKVIPGEPRFLYFHSLASFDIRYQSTFILKYSIEGSNLPFFDAKNVLSSQAVGFAFSSDGTLFMGLTKESGISCWNKFRDPVPENFKIIAEDDVRLEYINGMKTVKDSNTGEEELWALSNRLLAHENNGLDYDEYNFRILKKSVEKLVAGTICEIPRIYKKIKESFKPTF